jgi:hypothetical protein
MAELEKATRIARSVLGAAGEALDPLDALVAAQRHAEAMILTYRIAVDALVAERGDSALTVVDAKGTRATHPHLVELRHWNDQLRQMAVSQLKADVEERRARVTEMQLGEMRERLEGYAREKGIDLTDPAEVRQLQKWFAGDRPADGVPAALTA